MGGTMGGSPQMQQLLAGKGQAQAQGQGSPYTGGIPTGAMAGGGGMGQVFGGGAAGAQIPQSYWASQGLGAPTGGMQGHEYINPNLGVRQGDLRLASRQMGFEGDFGGGRQKQWAMGQGGWDPVVQQAKQVEEDRNAYNQQTYGIDPSRWNPAGVTPSQQDPRFGTPYGVSRRAMRNLGFGDDFGGGRGQGFMNQVGQPTINAEIQRMRGGLPTPTLNQPNAEMPPINQAFQPNYNMWFNPGLQSAMTMSGMQPSYGGPNYQAMDFPHGYYGANRFTTGLPSAIPDFGRFPEGSSPPSLNEGAGSAGDEDGWLFGNEGWWGNAIKPEWQR